MKNIIKVIRANFFFVLYLITRSENEPRNKFAASYINILYKK